MSRLAWRRGLIGLLLWVSLIGYGLSHLETNIEALAPWLPRNSPQRKEYDQFLSQFGHDSVLIVAWSDISLGDPRIEDLRERLLTAAGLHAGSSKADADKPLEGMIQDVIIARNLIQELQEKDQNLTRADAIEMLQPLIIGEDGQTTCVLVNLTQFGDQTPGKVVEEVLEICHEMPSIADQLHMTGRPYLGYYSSGVTKRSVISLSIPVAILSTLLAWVCLQRFSLMLLVILSSGGAALSSLAVVPLVGYPLNGLLTALPSLVYVVTTSASIHLVNYARHLPGSLTQPQFARAIYQKALKPCLLSAVSTGLGTLSLTASQFPAIQEFACFAAVGIMLSLAIQLLLMPFALSRLCAENHEVTACRDRNPILTQVFAWTVKSRWLVICGMLLLMLTFVPSLFQLEGQFEVDAIFDEDAEFMQDVRWFERHLGPVDTTEVVLGFKAQPRDHLMLQVDRIREVEQALQEIPGVTATYSAASMVPEIQGMLRRVFTRVEFGKHRKSLLGTAHLDERNGREYWRITLRSSFFDQSLRSGLRPRITAALNEATSDWEESPELIITGTSQITYETQGQVLEDFVHSVLLAFVLIFVMMSWALGSVSGGLCAMIPNLFPFLAIFGVLGLAGSKIDLGMTVAACIALGIAVDDTSHLLIRFQEAQQRTPNRLRALGRAYRECSLAMVQTSIICGVAMMPYILAALVYLQQFGIVLPLLMAAALLGDLIFLPALIASPIGVVFKSRRKSQGS